MKSQHPFAPAPAYNQAMTDRARTRTPQVLDVTNPTKRSQYATVSFALADTFTANTELVPATSVRVGVGASHTTANWTTPCQQRVAADYAARVAQSCGPSVSLCSPSPTLTLADRWLRPHLTTHPPDAPNCLMLRFAELPLSGKT